MNLHSWIQNVAGPKNIAASEGFFRQIRRDGLYWARSNMLLFVCARSFAVCLAGVLILAGLSPAAAQTNYYAANGTEYAVVGSLAGDQVHPDVAISTTNGIVVWQDNATDGDGWGISARRLDGTLSGTLGTFRVNAIGAGDQERPRVALLKGGGAVVVWEGGREGFQHIYARFLTVTNTFLSTNDLLVSTFTNNFQINPAVAVLTNGNVAVVWASYDQVSSNSLQDVYCQILSTNGTPIGANFLVNKFTPWNQRTPTVAALKNGGFVVAWVSEQEHAQTTAQGTNTTYVTAASITQSSVEIYARLFAANGTPNTDELLVNADNNPCSSPAAAVAADGTFMIVWCANSTVNRSNGWDVYGRTFSNIGTGGTVTLINTTVYGDQYIPRISVLGNEYLVTWTSLGQDGSREGVYGQFLYKDASPVGGEFVVNTTTAGQQMQPTVASDGVSEFLTIWTSYTGSPNYFDLFAQRYVNVASILLAMSAPYVWAPFVVTNNTYQPQLVVTWPPLAGLSIADYEVYANGASSPTAVVTNNAWTMTAANGLTANSTNYFTVDYMTTDGRRSPMSPAGSGTTWGIYSWGGIPFQWMAAYYGSDLTEWPSATSKVGPNMTLYQVFLSGGNPLNSSTWLQQHLVKTPQGMFLFWNTQPGATYQAQVSTNLTTWSNLGSPRFAAGTSDSVNIGGAIANYYQVKLLR